MWKALRERLEFFSKKEWENIVLVRSVIDWIFKFLSWNLMLAALIVIQRKTHSVILLIVCIILGWLLIMYLYRVLLFLVSVKPYEDRGVTHPTWVAPFGLLMIVTLIWFVIDYTIVVGIIDAVIRVQEGKF